jgi:hypothetical protein
MPESAMNASECRRKAKICRDNANRSWGEIERGFREAAELWEKLAKQLDRLSGHYPIGAAEFGAGSLQRREP